MYIPTPCHIIDLDKLTANLSGPIRQVRQQTQCKMMLAIKGFSSDTILPYMKDAIDGISASGAFEARLGRELVNKQVCTFSPAYQDQNIKTIVNDSDTVIFNSVHQFRTYHLLAVQAGCSCGIRINPEYSELPEDFGPNPCQPFSRLGIKFEDMPDLTEFTKGQIEGIHLHTMCEQNSDTLERTLMKLQNRYDSYLKRIRWLNLGGGQMYSSPDYDIDRAIRCINEVREKYDIDIILEPCEGIVAGCGCYVVSVVDIVQNGMPVAIVDGSGICHMPDAVYRDWRHEIKDADEVGVRPYVYRITGPTCYAGDIWGDYSFSRPLNIGDHIVFEDTAAYTIVKNNTFNGLPMPSLATYSEADGLIVKKQYDYASFLRCQ